MVDSCSSFRPQLKYHLALTSPPPHRVVAHSSPLFTPTYQMVIIAVVLTSFPTLLLSQIILACVPAFLLIVYLAMDHSQWNVSSPKAWTLLISPWYPRCWEQGKTFNR